MAAFYVETIRHRMEHGPYYLGGWSMGGTIAWEMSRQLRDDGERVAFLALIDTYAPPPRSRRREDEMMDDASVLRRFARDLGLLEELDGPSLESVLQQARRCGLLDENYDLERIDLLFRLFKNNMSLIYKYSSCRTVDVDRIVLFRAQDDFRRGLDVSLGWSHWTAGNLEIRETPGNHFSLLHEPHVRELAEMLRSDLSLTER